MRKCVWFAVIIAFFVSTSYVRAACTSLNIGYANNWFPLAYDSKDQKSIGIAIDIQREIFRRLNIKTTYVSNIPWKRQLVMLEEGDLDAYATIFYTKERAERFDYTASFLEKTIHVFKGRNSALEFRELKDLIGFVGVAPLGANFGPVYTAFEKKHLNLIHMSGTKKFIEVVRSGRADYFVIPKDLADYLIAQHGAENDIVITGPPVAVQPVHMAFSKVGNCANLIPEINHIIDEMRKAGELDQIRISFMQSVPMN